MVNGFTTLSELVREKRKGTVTVPQVSEQITEYSERQEAMDAAGFTASANQARGKERELSEIQTVAVLTNQLINDGYLVLDVPYYFTGGWQYGNRFFSKPIESIQEVKTKALFGSKLEKKRIDTGYSLVLCNHYDWKAEVPISVARTLIEFKEKYVQENESGRFHVLSVLPTEQIDFYIQSQDPLLLFQLGGHGNSRFAVVAWWGADIEAIERELDLDRYSMRSVKVLEALR